LFLAGILVPCRRARTLVSLVTCFTVAHSLTLLWSTLAGVSVPARFVEPFIAASIVFVGLENLLTRDRPRARAVLTFAFGLVHGLGFAAGLRELGLDGSAALPLFAFNVGVELGQVAASLLLFPLIVCMRQHPLGPLVARTVSIGITTAGAYWFLERTLLALVPVPQPWMVLAQNADRLADPCTLESSSETGDWPNLRCKLVKRTLVECRTHEA
jgi:hydrogenase/urease accessory protein HupE